MSRPTSMHPEDQARVDAIIVEMHQQAEAAGRGLQHKDIGRGCRHALQQLFQGGDLWAMRATLTLADEGAYARSRQLRERSTVRIEGSKAPPIAASYSVKWRNAEGQWIYQGTFVRGMTLKDLLKVRKTLVRQRNRTNQVLAQIDVMIAIYRRFPQAATLQEAADLAGVRLEVLFSEAS